MDSIMAAYNSLDSFNYSNEIEKKPTQLNCAEFWETFLDLTPAKDNRHERIHETVTLLIRSDSSTEAKTKSKIVNNYPTKNCLALFKSAHFAYLEKQAWDYKEFEELRVLHKKSGVSKMDFVSIYKIKELENVWRRMFQRKYLFHYLMISRSLSKQKSIFQGQVRVLEKAFLTKQFPALTIK